MPIYLLISVVAEKYLLFKIVYGTVVKLCKISILKKQSVDSNGKTMNRILKRAILPALVATSLVGANIAAVKPASADQRLIHDIGVGAGGGAAAGLVTNRRHTWRNAVNGAAAGAAVHAVNHGGRHKSRNVARDAAVGAAAGTAAGLLTDRKHTWRNAVNGAAAGTAVNVLGR